jgi:hypothetical protein
MPRSRKPKRKQSKGTAPRRVARTKPTPYVADVHPGRYGYDSPGFYLPREQTPKGEKQ